MIPAWTILDRTSLAALLTRAPRPPGAVQVAAVVPAVEIVNVPIIRATRLMIERAQANGGLTLTKGGALSRADVKALFDATEWPDYDRAAVLTMNKVLNEDDVLPVLFTRMVAQEARLLRSYKGRLLATKRGTELLDLTRASDLFRAAFETVFWQTNLAYLDRMPAEHWPQTHIGIVLWSLSVAAHEWSKPEELLATCTIPDEELAAAAHDLLAFAMVARVLRPLTWFGLMERKEAEDQTEPAWRQPRLYRKTPLFDRALSFVVTVRKSEIPLQ